MKFTTIFFDLDDTLYPPAAGLWKEIKNRIGLYMHEHMNIPIDEVASLREKYFLQYGTTMRGLQANHKIDTEDFLAYVHDLPLRDYLTPNLILRDIIASLPTCNLIFTNADIRHADNVLTALNLRDLFETIVDINMINPYCKPMPKSFQIAMKIANETAASKCVMIDDINRNTRGASAVGLFSILYNEKFNDGDADAQLTDWSQVKEILENAI